MVDDRSGNHRAAESAGVVKRERAALHVLDGQAVGPRPLGDVVDRVSQAGDRQTVGVVNHRHYQAVGRRHRQPQVDAPLEDNRIAAPGRVHCRHLAQRLHHRPDDKGHEGEAHALLPLELGSYPLPEGHQPSDVHFLDAPGVGNLGDAAHHRLGDHAPHRSDGHAFFVRTLNHGCSGSGRRGGCGRWDCRSRRRLRLGQEFQHIVAGYTATHSRTVDPAQVHRMLPGKPPDGGRETRGPVSSGRQVCCGRYGGSCWSSRLGRGWCCWWKCGLCSYAHHRLRGFHRCPPGGADGSHVPQQVAGGSYGCRRRIGGREGRRRCRWWRFRRWRLAGFPHLGYGRAHGQRFPFCGQHSQQLALHRGGNFHGHLVGDHFNQRLIPSHRVAGLFQPFPDGAFHHRLANVRKLYRYGQLRTTRLDSVTSPHGEYPSGPLTLLGGG